MRVEMSEHDPAWARRFASVGAQLREVFGDSADRIDHIGSTSVPGLAAKPIIDVQVSLPDLANVEGFRDALADLFLELMVNEDRRKWYARRRADGAETNVHIRRTGEFSQQAALLFRDYLRPNTPLVVDTNESRGNSHSANGTESTTMRTPKATSCGNYSAKLTAGAGTGGSQAPLTHEGSKERSL